MQTVFEALSPEARHYLQEHRQSRTVKRGDVIYRAGDRPTGLYLIHHGLVGLVIHSAKGTDHLLRLFRSGQFFAHRSYFANEPHHATSLALEASEISYISHDDVEEIIRIDPGFLRHVVEYLAKELRAAEVHRVMVSEQDVLARTAHAVAVMKDFAPGHRWTRSEIASFCASTTPTVVRALAELEARGLIRQVGRDIEVLNREALLAFESLES